MKTMVSMSSNCLFRLGLLILAAWCWAAPVANARTITLSLEFSKQQYSTIDPYFFGQTYYTVNVFVSSDVPSVTYDEVDSPVPAYSGSESGSGETLFGDIGSALNAMTNGNWTLTVNKGDVSEKQYTFTVSANGIDNNSFPAVQIIMPVDGNPSASTNSSFSWSGPASWDELDLADHNIDYSFYFSDSPSPSATTWNDPPALPLGTNEFEVSYKTNGVAWFTISTPVDNLSHPFTNWVGGAKLVDFVQSGFVTSANPATSGGNGHTNVAYYSFEDNDLFAHDFSGNGNDINTYGDYSQSPYITNDAAAGLYAFATPGDGWLYPPTNLLTTLAGSFSVSLWLKTSETNGNDDDDVYSAAGIVSALYDGVNDVVPMGLNGSKLAFYTGGNSEDTLHSLTSVNTGQYVHVVVTRDQQTGEKKIYINGVLDTSDFGSTNLLNDPTGLDIGYNNGRTLTGEMDDIQFYSGVLSASEVSQLYNNPGTTIPDSAGSADNGLVAHYDFDEGNVVAPDVSGNGNNAIVAGNIDYYDGDNPVISNDTISGAGSVSFDGYGFLTPSTNLLSTIAGTFSLSLWVKTTDDSGYQGDVAWDGAGIVSADSPNSLVNGDIIPVALTGGQVAFNTGSPEYGDDTLNSSTLVNDGQWHHIVVMRNQLTGEKDIYIDGELDNSDFDTTDLLTDPQLLTIGCKADASDSDPNSPSDTGSNGYTGLIDDIQIYNRILTADEVAFLYNNPGATLGGATTNTPYPVDVNLQFGIIRSQDPNLGEIYGGSVSFNSVSPAPSTTNSVHSPHNYFYTEQYPGGGTGSGAILSSLNDVIDEFTNGSWTIYINQGSPTQQVYSFQVSISGLDTNLLKAVEVFYPTNGAVNVATNPVFYWNGPTNFSTLVVDLLSGPAIFPPVDTTNWPSPPTLNYGADRFDVAYTSNNFPGVTFTTPVDASSNPVESWTATVNLVSQSFNNFVVGAPAPLPVLLTNLTRAGGNLQFSFQTLAGRPHTIQSRTNLTLGAWVNMTNFVGDGSLKQFTFPATNPPVQFFRVNTQ
jgi:Concanavalin A-like lectin/glucanases superfamily